MTDLQRAQSALETFGKKRGDLISKQASLAERIRATEAAAGQRYLDGDEAVAAELGRMRLEADVVVRALAALETQEVEAKRTVTRAEIRDKRARAGQLRTEVSELQKRVERALSEVSKLEEVRFDCSVLHGQRVGDWTRSVWGAQRTHPVSLLNPLEVSAEMVGPNAAGYAVTRSRRMSDEAYDLDAEADKIERALQREESEQAITPSFPRQFPFVNEAVSPPMRMIAPGVGFIERPAAEVSERD